LDQALIPLKIAFLEIVEMPPPLSYHLQEAPAGMVILNVNLEVLGEVLDTLTQQGDLHFRRAGIRLMNPKLLDHSLLLLLSNSHVISPLFSLFLSFLVASVSTTPVQACKGMLEAGQANKCNCHRTLGPCFNAGLNSDRLAALDLEI
jgi:hypothetical protein